MNRISRLKEKAEKIRQRMREDKTLLESVEAAIVNESAMLLSETTNTPVAEFDILAREHEQMQQMKSAGMTEQDIQAMIESFRKTKRQENDDENKVF